METGGGGDFVGIQATGPASDQGTAGPEEKDGCVAQTQTLRARPEAQCHVRGSHGVG